jgi:hypothetical protein
MNFLDRLLGRTPAPTVAVNTLRPQRPATFPDADAAAVERYRYLLRTAPPDDLERAHAEAFERLTPEQRDVVRKDLQAAVPPGEAPRSTDPQDMARVATRAEMRNPGTLERAFSGGPAAPGMAGSFMQTFAAVFVGTTVAQALFGGFGDPMAGDAGAADAGGWDGGATGTDTAGMEDMGDMGDMGGFGDFGDFGGFEI